MKWVEKVTMGPEDWETVVTGLGATGSLKKAVNLAFDNPSIIGLSFLIALLGQISAFFGNLFLQYAIIVLLFPVSYFFMAGLYTLAVKAQTGKVPEWPAVFIEGGKRKWISLLLGGLFFAGAIIVFALGSELLFIIGALIFGGIAFFIGRLINEIVGMALMALMLLIITPLFFGLMGGLVMFLQFFDIGIVAGDYGVIQSFKESFSFTRERFNSVFGYTVVKYLGLFILSIPLMPFFLAYFKESFANPTALYLSVSMVDRFGAVFLLGAVAVGTLAAAFTYTYHTTFYVQNIDVKGKRESISRILLKLYGIGLLTLIVFTAMEGLMFYQLVPGFREMLEQPRQGEMSMQKAQGLPFYEDFEEVPVGVYPYTKGWVNQYKGEDAYVSDEYAHSGVKSFRLDAAPGFARKDYVRIL